MSGEYLDRGCEGDSPWATDTVSEGFQLDNDRLDALEKRQTDLEGELEKVRAEIAAICQPEGPEVTVQTTNLPSPPIEVVAAGMKGMAKRSGFYEYERKIREGHLWSPAPNGYKEWVESGRPKS